MAILGPLEVCDEAGRLELGPYKQRVVLGLLLCNANKVVSVSAFSEALWDDEPPRTAHKNLQVYVSTLRKLLRLGAGESDQGTGSGTGSLLHRAPGYVLQVAAEQVDALMFHELARAGRLAARGGDMVGAAGRLGQALALWRGAVLAELHAVPAIVAEAARLADRYLAAYEDWAEAELALGHHADLAEDIAEHARRHPLRERLRHAQMLALYRSGRQAEALAQFDALRQALARDLGLRPSPVLGRLYEAMLAGDRALDAADPGAPVTVRPPRAARTHLIRDVADFTGRDRETATLLEAFGGAGHGRVAVISGPVGVGKTTLAAHCAHRLGDRFPGGRAAAGLRAPDGGPRPFADVFAELLRGVGISGALPRGVEARAAALRQSAAGRATLFVLDDAVSEAQVGSALSLMGDAGLLVTCRRPPDGVEAAVQVRLAPVSADESLELLERIIGGWRVEVEPEAAWRLVEICGGLPLALRVVGAKLAGLRHLSLARFAERLADEDRLLDELVAGDLRIRPRLTAAYRDLEPEDRMTLRRLAACGRDGFQAAEAAALLGTGVAQAEYAIERLVQCHFVDVQGADTAVGEADAEVQAHAWSREPCFALPPLVLVFLREQRSC